MPVTSNTPLVIKDALVTFGADNFERAISSIVFTPTAASIVWKGISPLGTFTDIAIADWAAAITYTQDWDTVGSLSQFLFNNEGQTVTMTFRPRNGVGPSFSAQVVITPGAIGGAANGVAEATVNLGVQGKPTIVSGAPAIAVVASGSPATGPIAGGTLVKITGSKFTGATAVRFGTTPATQYTVESDSTIYAVAPAQAAGSKPVTVVNATGTSSTSAPYTYA